MLQVQIPEKLAPLLQPARYKGAHGGRGGAKSHFFAQLAVVTAYSKPENRGVCIREVQNSIKDSVKQLIEDKISLLGLEPFFNVTRDEIRGSNGSLIIFKGMQSYNAENIKSLEGFDWAWVEEAQTLSERSWRMLRPTIRKPGSEIWCSWNPRHDTDAVDSFLRGARKPENAIVVEINWPDNPWFPTELIAEKDADFANDPEMAEHVWNGGYEIVSEGAYYARWIAQAEREGRVGQFPYDPKLRLRTAWDIGVDDYMTCWFIQDNGVTATAVDYYETNGEGFDAFVSKCMPEIFIPPIGEPDFAAWDRAKALEELGRPQPFAYAGHFLPHDVRVREPGSGAKHRYELLARLGVKPISKGVATNPEERIAAGRRLLTSMRFDANPRVLHGLKRLRRYRRKFNEAMGIWEGPAKDGNDHGADAFGEYALNAELLPQTNEPPRNPIAELLRPRTIEEIVSEELDHADD